MSPVLYDPEQLIRPMVFTPKPAPKPSVASAAPKPQAEDDEVDSKKKPSVAAAYPFSTNTPIKPMNSSSLVPSWGQPLVNPGNTPAPAPQRAPGTPLVQNPASAYNPTMTNTVAGSAPRMAPGTAGSPAVGMHRPATFMPPATVANPNPMASTMPANVNTLGPGVQSVTPDTTVDAAAAGVAPAAVDPEQAKRAIYAYAQQMTAGIVLAPEQLAELQTYIMAASGLDQPVRIQDPVTHQLQEKVLNLGELETDENGMTRGVRANLVVGIMGQYVDRPDQVAAVASQQVGGGGLTIDEIRMVFPFATDRNLGADWANTPGAMDVQGGQGYVMSSPNGQSSAPIFSGFYLAGDGKYYPLNTAALAQQGFGKRPWIDYGAAGDEKRADRWKQAPKAPAEPDVNTVDQDLRNSGAGSVAQLNQNLQ